MNQLPSLIPFRTALSTPRVSVYNRSLPNRPFTPLDAPAGDRVMFGARNAKIPTPHEIGNYISRYVIDQEPAIQPTALAVYDHLNRISEEMNLQIEDPRLEYILPPEKMGRLLEMYFIADGVIPMTEIATYLAPICSENASLTSAQTDTLRSTLEGLLEENLLSWNETKLAEQHTFSNVASSNERMNSVMSQLRQIIQLGLTEANTQARNDKAARDRKASIRAFKASVLGDIPVDEPARLAKQNMLLIGPTGVGKSHIPRQIQRFFKSQGFDIPLFSFNASNLTTAGYRGGDLEDIARGLIDRAGGDVEKAQCGIVVLEEFDKLYKKPDSGGADVNGDGAQNVLLNALEDGGVHVQLEPGKSPIFFSFKNVLFIATGAFSDIEPILRKNHTPAVQPNLMGFGPNTSSVEPPQASLGELMQQMNAEDLREYGFKPEIVGRIPLLVALRDLTVSTLRRILTEPPDALLKQYTGELARDEIKLEFTPDALDRVAELSVARGTRARALTSIMEKTMRQIRYEAPELPEGSTIRVTAHTVDDPTQYEIVQPNAEVYDHFSVKLSLSA